MFSSVFLKYVPSSRHKAERTITERGAQYTSDKCILTLIIPEMRREDAGFYKCYGPDRDKATRIVHVGGISEHSNMSLRLCAERASK